MNPPEISTVDPQGFADDIANEYADLLGKSLKKRKVKWLKAAVGNVMEHRELMLVQEEDLIAAESNLHSLRIAVGNFITEDFEELTGDEDATANFLSNDEIVATAQTHSAQLREGGRVFTDHEKALGARDARRKLAEALQHLAELTPQPEGLAHTEARVNAVMAVVTSMFPKQNAFAFRGQKLKVADPDLRPPTEWEAFTGIKVRDPDGWRADGLGWDVPITREDFERRCASSTTEGMLTQAGKEALARSEREHEEHGIR